MEHNWDELKNMLCLSLIWAVWVNIWYFAQACLFRPFEYQIKFVPGVGS